MPEEERPLRAVCHPHTLLCVSFCKTKQSIEIVKMITSMGDDAHLHDFYRLGHHHLSRLPFTYQVLSNCISLSICIITTTYANKSNMHSPRLTTLTLMTLILKMVSLNSFSTRMYAIAKVSTVSIQKVNRRVFEFQKKIYMFKKYRTQSSV